MRSPSLFHHSSGLTILTQRVPDLTTVTVLVLVKNGSDYEKKSEGGISHFIEHLLFKGSKKFPTPVQVSIELDKLGADYNAYTANEYTGYYIKTFPAYLNRAIDILSDLLINPQFPSEEIEKERKVIIEEINHNEDTPTWLIHDLLAASLYGQQSAGRPILGTKEQVRGLTRKQIQNFHRQHYVARNTLIVVAGNFPSTKIVQKILKAFHGLPRVAAPRKSPTKVFRDRPRIFTFKKKVRQAHLILSTQTEGVKAIGQRRFALGLLASVLGYGSSSRMFNLLREQLGATYYLNVGHQSFTDRGYLSIQTGSDLTRLKTVLQLMVAELQKLKNESVPETELDKAKAVLENRYLMSTETSDSLAGFLGISYLIEKDLMSPAEIIKRIKLVSSKEVRAEAQRYLLPQNLNLAIMLPEAPSFSITPILKTL